MTGIIIFSNGSIDSFYESIMEMLDDRYHHPGNAFPSYHISADEIVDIESLCSYASHVSDDLHLNGVHIERLIS